MIRDLLKGGKLVRYGAKAMPVGGGDPIPQVTSGGVMLIGDAGGVRDGEGVKGIHTAIKAGMLAAETILDSLVKNDYSRGTLSAFDARLKDSYIGRELYKARNFHQAFDRGRLVGLAIAGVSTLTGGRLPVRLPIKAVTST